MLPLLRLTAAFLLLSIWGCQPATQSQGPRGFILISIDTLRADHLGSYGYERPTSPFIDSLADRGTLFENAYVQLPGTLPSHMSIFTGLYPEEHGVFPPSGILSTTLETLPQAFQRSGFRTAGHTEGGYVNALYGFDRGFDEFDDSAEKLETDIEDTFARGVNFLEGLQQDDRFFLFLHTYSVHDPYFPAPEYLEPFWPGEPPADAFEATGPNLVEVNRGKRTISPQTLDYFVASYDASIRYMDDVLKQFFEQLEALGLSDDVTIVLTSDHGEEFLEHGRLVHEQIYPESLHVPLIVLHPGQPQGRRVSEVVESTDIFPTLLEIAGIEQLLEVSGQSLLPQVMGTEPAAHAGSGDGSSSNSGSQNRAFAVTQAKSKRTVIDHHGDRKSQLVIHKVPPGAWVHEVLEFDLLPNSDVIYEASSFHQPRMLTMEVDGGDARQFEVYPDRWTPLPMAHVEPVKHRIRLFADGCISPAELGQNEDKRCLSFRVQGSTLRKFELFDLHKDRLAANDISGQDLEELRRLSRLLQDHTPQAKAITEDHDLPPELVERLKALGYLQ